MKNKPIQVDGSNPVIDKHYVQSLEDTIARLENQLAAIRAHETRDVWYWQGDGGDHLQSLCCHVVIHANQLRRLLNDQSDFIIR